MWWSRRSPFLRPFSFFLCSSVITRAGILKKEFPKDEEEELLLRALCDVNIPKFLKPDLPLFAGIISDLFPTTKPPVVSHGALTDSLILTCKEEGLQPVDSFIDKCIQLYESVTSTPRASEHWRRLWRGAGVACFSFFSICLMSVAVSNHCV